MTRKIYVSGPYTHGDPLENTRIAMEAGNRLLDAGHAPFVPHLSHFWESETPRHYEDWMRIDLAFVPCCDALLRLPGYSPGADREVALAEECGIPVFGDIDGLTHHFIEATTRD